MDALKIQRLDSILPGITLQLGKIVVHGQIGYFNPGSIVRVRAENRVHSRAQGIAALIVGIGNAEISAQLHSRLLYSLAMNLPSLAYRESFLRWMRHGNQVVVIAFRAEGPRSQANDQVFRPGDGLLWILRVGTAFRIAAQDGIKSRYSAAIARVGHGFAAAVHSSAQGDVNARGAFLERRTLRRAISRGEGGIF